MPADTLKLSGFNLFVVSTLLVLSIILYTGLPGLHGSPLLGALWNLGHCVFYALWVIALRWVPRFSGLSLLRQWLLAMGFTVLTGVLIEILQIGTDRQSDVMDVIRDMGGAMLVLSFHPQYRLSKYPQSYRAIRILSVALMLFLLWPLTQLALDRLQAAWSYPLLADFEQPFERSRWSGTADFLITSLNTASDDQWLEVELTSDSRYSGVTYRGLTCDLAVYDYLKLALFNPMDRPLELTLSIFDKQHTGGDYFDRFNLEFILQPGSLLLQVPTEDIAWGEGQRSLDLNAITGIAVFASDEPLPAKFYIEKLYLE